MFKALWGQNEVGTIKYEIRLNDNGQRNKQKTNNKQKIEKKENIKKSVENINNRKGIGGIFKPCDLVGFN